MKEPKAVKRWTGTPPTMCQICHEKLTLTNGHVYFFDFKTRSGLWAVGCAKCFEQHGGHLGNGYGQKYRLGDGTKVS